MAIFCTACGTQHPDAARFCMQCGQPMRPGVSAIRPNSEISAIRPHPGAPAVRPQRAARFEYQNLVVSFPEIEDYAPNLLPLADAAVLSALHRAGAEGWQADGRGLTRMGLDATRMPHRARLPMHRPIPPANPKRAILGEPGAAEWP